MSDAGKRGGPFYVGIDLGTTSCAVARADSAGRLGLLTNFEGDVLTPSALLFDGQTILVGREAVKQSATKPDLYAECFKRHTAEPTGARKIDGRVYRAEFLSAVLLRRLKADTERQLGPQERAVITVPAYFDESRRRATRDAGTLAGWTVADIINEPTAAALAYAYEHGGKAVSDRPERLLVYDLGGGTFDTTVLEVRPGREYCTIATEGDVRLGGRDWDEKLQQHLAEQFRSKAGGDPLASPAGRQTFLNLARQIKHTLSQRDSVRVPCVFEGRRAALEVTRQTFESLTAGLLDRTHDTTELVLEAAGLDWSDVDRVLLIGGSSRMPMVARMLEEAAGKPPDRSLAADEAVARGAAVYAYLSAADSSVRVVNVNAHSLRIIGRDRNAKRVAYPMIAKNTHLPATKTQWFPVTRPGQLSVRLEICEGESEDPDHCESIGHVRIDGLPETVDKLWQVGVRLKFNIDGTVSVKASVRDPDSLDTEIKRVKAVLEPNRSYTPEELAEARQLLDTFEIP